MKVTCIGGGPGGLYFALLLKKALPDAEIDVFEQNKADDTFGWGVVFSDETMENFEEADPESYRSIRDRFAYWKDIDTWYRGECIRSTGHGFCGLARVRLLQILHERCQQVGVRLHFQEIIALEAARDADLIVAADGVSSRVREQLAERLQPTVDWRKCKFAWFGTDLEMQAFTFIFLETGWGLFQVHAYPFEPGRGTFIVECREETWKKAGLEGMDEEATAAFCEKLFGEHLKGHRLLINKSVWRNFPTVSCEKWHHGNVVLLGDAAHTAHFSIGSGTKLAMEDSIALARAVAGSPEDLGAALAGYEEERKPVVVRTQRAAQTSLEWFENSARYLGQEPLRFTFNLMTRSNRITYDNLRTRDPELVAEVDALCAKETGHKVGKGEVAPPPAFLPLELRELKLHNRIVVSAMCQYSARDGVVNDWHLVHLGSRAVGGAGLVMTEMTDVLPDGRITRECAGLWDDHHVVAWRRIVDFVHENSAARIGIQLAHAGRKGSVEHPWTGSDVPLRKGWETLAPSAIPFQKGWPRPKEMDHGDMDTVREAFVAAARMAEECGFDLIELHMAHGYLLSSFLSPLSNQRQDEYGGSLRNRARFPLEVFMAVRAKWPAARPMAVRISASDWFPDKGFTVEEAVEVTGWLEECGCDLIDVSSAGNVPDSPVTYGRMYQVPFAEQIKRQVKMPVMAVGGIFSVDHVNTIIGAGRADACAIARTHLTDPYLSMRASQQYGLQERPWPDQYLLARR